MDKKTRARGNGDGSVYKRGAKWAACVTVYENGNERKTKIKQQCCIMRIFVNIL